MAPSLRTQHRQVAGQPTQRICSRCGPSLRMPKRAVCGLAQPSWSPPAWQSCRICTWVAAYCCKRVGGALLALACCPHFVLQSAFTSITDAPRYRARQGRTPQNFYWQLAIRIIWFSSANPAAVTPLTYGLRRRKLYWQLATIIACYMRGQWNQRRPAQSGSVITGALVLLLLALLLPGGFYRSIVGSWVLSLVQ